MNYIDTNLAKAAIQTISKQNIAVGAYAPKINSRNREDLALFETFFQRGQKNVAIIIGASRYFLGDQRGTTTE
jgi:hypothetical protein